MNIDDISKAIGKWRKLKNKASKIQKLLDQGHMFELSLMERAAEEKFEFLHVYPGIYRGRLSLFAIGSHRDKEEQHNSIEGLLPYLMPCSVDRKNLPELIDPIPNGEGLKRIHEWSAHHSTWLKKEVKTEFGIHECFAIPTKHLQVNRTYQAFFALKGGIVPGVFQADLVLFDPQNREFTLELRDEPGFFDTVRLVPPFSPDLDEESTPELNRQRYFLLKLSELVLVEE